MPSPKIIIRNLATGNTIGAGDTDTYVAGGVPSGVFCSFKVELTSAGTVNITNFSTNDGTRKGTGAGFIIANSGSSDVTYNILGLIVMDSGGSETDLSEMELTQINKN